MNIENLVRENIKKLAPYTTARHEYKGAAEVYLDANENAFGSPLASGVGLGMVLNRYPDPLQLKVKEKLSLIKGVPVKNIFLGNGSDEAIDVLLRIFCEPRVDNIIICPPTYGMYKVSANINDVTIKEIALTPEFQLDLNGIETAIDANTKLIFICSPNNPTGNSINANDIEIILNNFNGIVVIDEAYINYSKQKTFISALTEYPNLVIMQTLSKAWGLAGLRVGMAFAGDVIMQYMNNVKYPYNINESAQQLVLQALENIAQVNEWTKQTIIERNLLEQNLVENNLCEKVYTSDANFILVQFKEAKKLYDALCENGIIVRDRSKVILCDNCLRITIGTKKENEKLLLEIKKYYLKN
jgi:histidinol-phosphate aminotransferase